VTTPFGTPTPSPAGTPFDTGNGLLAESPAMLTTAVVTTPMGQRLALTIRTPSTSLTVFLAGADGKKWAAQLTRDASGMSSAGLVVPNGIVPKPKGGDG
jgi:hypothetical protein